MPATPPRASVATTSRPVISRGRTTSANPGSVAAGDGSGWGVYAELHRIAARYFRHERPGHTLQATGLVHEAYLKLIDQERLRWQNRAQFFGVAAQLTRRILVDHARTSNAAKRGGDSGL